MSASEIPNVVAQVRYKHCCEVFASKGKYQVHYRHQHQHKARLNDIEQGETSVERDTRGKYKCVCDKECSVWQDMNKHRKSCNEWGDLERDEIQSQATEDGTLSTTAE